MNVSSCSLGFSPAALRNSADLDSDRGSRHLMLSVRPEDGGRTLHTHDRRDFRVRLRSAAAVCLGRGRTLSYL